jgi:hypothetical protein
VKLEMFFRLTGNVSYPLMILTSLLQFPLLLVRYNQGFRHLMLLDLPLLFFSTASVVLFYGTAVWYLDRPRPGRRLLHLPLVMGLGIGLAFSNARAVLEALLGIKTEFVRTPKYRVEGGGDAGAAGSRPSSSPSRSTSCSPSPTRRTWACGAPSLSSLSSASATAIWA